MTTAPISYRPDIDGLRAVAVVPVVLAHAGVSFAQGGFVGVDVFFVISGFLITSIIAGEIRDGTFSLAHFYERRARRLLPSLFAVLAAIFIAGLFLLTPMDMRLLGKSIAAAAGFVANFYYANRGGYFDDQLEEDPLLHTWSLAVEEQFYIVWPLLLIALYKRAGAGRVVAAVLALLALSFAASVWGVANASTKTYFHPHTRAWELLVGCLLALDAVRPPASQRAADAASVTGLTAILAAVLLYDADTPFPGLAALLPVAGAALVLWSGVGRVSLAGRLLSTRPLVFIGLISYAWYLWHWPMFAFFRAWYERPAEGMEIALIIVASLAMAALCWRYLERPVRRRDGGFSGDQVFKGAGAGLTVTAALCVAALYTGGFANRFPEAMRAYLPENIERTARTGRRCGSLDADQVRAGMVCRIAEGGGRAILLWGDSHAAAIAPALSELGKETGRAVYFGGQAGCPPLIGVQASSASLRQSGCENFNAAMAEFIARERPTDVVLAARWNMYAEGPPPFGFESRRRPAMLTDADSRTLSLEENRAVLARGLDRTVDTLRRHGIRVWVFEQVPYAGSQVPRDLARRMMRGLPTTGVLGPPAAIHETQTRNVRHIFEQAAKAGGLRRIDPGPVFCPNETCRLELDGQPLYFDDDHISGLGARQMLGQLRPIFDGVPTER